MEITIASPFLRTVSYLSFQIFITLFIKTHTYVHILSQTRKLELN